jgi:hypothetical protein
MNKFIVDTVDLPTICRALNTSGDSKPVGRNQVKYNSEEICT